MIFVINVIQEGGEGTEFLRRLQEMETREQNSDELQQEVTKQFIKISFDFIVRVILVTSTIETNELQ